MSISASEARKTLFPLIERVNEDRTYVTEIGTAIERIAEDPSRGRACHEIRDGYRRYGIGSHVIFYHEPSSGVDVIRILHQRIDPAKHM